MELKCRAKLLLRGLLMLLILVIPTACEVSETRCAGAITYPLELTFCADRVRAVAGKPIHMRFTITNVHQQQQPWVEESPDTPVMDIVVDVVGGPELLAWSTQNPDKVVHQLEWKPGESKMIELIWTPRQEDIAFGYYQDVFLGGLLYRDGKSIQGANVQICASNFCR